MAQIDVYAWGRGDCGQLGLTEASEAATALPQVLEPLRGKNIVSLGAGSFHTTGITSDGEIYAWGANDEGQCARKEPGVEQVVTPTRIEVLENYKIGGAACGANHTIAVSDDGGVFGFGAADFGQLGVGPVSSSKIIQPKACKTLKEAGRITRAAAGGNHTLFLETSGTIYVTGDASFGALGISSNTTTGNDNKRAREDDDLVRNGNVETSRGVQSKFSPVELCRLWPVGVCQIAAGDAHSAALTIDGTVYTWGRGKSGALGTGHFQNLFEPALVRALRGMFIKQISCGSDHIVALTQEGHVYASGSGKYGATGLGHSDSVCTPQRMAGLLERESGAEAVSVVQVSAGGRHTLLLTQGNEVWATGSNEHGQCGQHKLKISSTKEEEMTEEDDDVVLVPRPLAGLPSSSLILFVASGGDHSFAVVQSSSLLFGAENEKEIITAKEGTIAATQMLLPGPRLERHHGDRWLPSTPAPLLPLVRAARSTDAETSDAMKALRSCLHATFANPSYLINAFRTTSGSLMTEEHTAPLGVPSLDLTAISEMYQGILKLYDQEIVTVLGSASIKILESKFTLRKFFFFSVYRYIDTVCVYFFY
jgi:E3 ubiquitin-protein ligase HERC4